MLLLTGEMYAMFLKHGSTVLLWLVRCMPCFLKHGSTVLLLTVEFCGLDVPDSCSMLTEGTQLSF